MCSRSNFATSAEINKKNAASRKMIKRSERKNQYDTSKPQNSVIMSIVLCTTFLPKIHDTLERKVRKNLAAEEHG